MIDYNKQLLEHRAIYGTNYQLPDGSHKRMTDEEVRDYMKSRNLTLRVPSFQASSLEELLIGIK